MKSIIIYIILIINLLVVSLFIRILIYFVKLRCYFIEYIEDFFGGIFFSNSICVYIKF